MDFFVILYGEHASFNITGLAYLGASGFCKRRGHARKRPNSSARTGIGHGIGCHVGRVHGVIVMSRTNVVDIVWCLQAQVILTNEFCRVGGC